MPPGPLSRPPPPKGLNLLAVNPASTAGAWTKAFNSGRDEVVFDSVSSLVREVTGYAKAKGSPFRKLVIADHGSMGPSATGQAEFGIDLITTINFSLYEAQFRALRTVTAPSSTVILGHCDIGQDLNLLGKFANAFGTKVIAGTGYTNGALGVNYGKWVAAYPGGVITRCEFYLTPLEPTGFF